VCREAPDPYAGCLVLLLLLGDVYPDPNFSIPDPGSGVEKIQDSDAQQRI
jgi:hypothetical protein